MRELKFRCWGIKENKYLKLHSIHLSTSKVIVSYYGVGGGNVSKALKDVVLEQYTGLKDKNGKEIYEGDIVSMPSTECAVVAYDAGSFILECTHCSAAWNMNTWCTELGLRLGTNICTDVKVIGNIHENKELLDVQ